MNDVVATLTEIRADGKQKWERDDLRRSDHMRYIWLSSFQSLPGANVGSRARLAFDKGPGGSWALWKAKEFTA